MSNYSGIYQVMMSAVSISTGITLCQINAASDAPVELLRAWVSFNSTTSTALEIGLKRVTTAGTGTGSPTALLLRPGDAAFGGTVSVQHSAEGTLGDILIREYSNYLSGWLYLPVPEERIRLAPSGRLSLYLPSAPGAAVTITAGMVFGEI